jgi:hypothetical protein
VAGTVGERLQMVMPKATSPSLTGMTGRWRKARIPHTFSLSTDRTPATDTRKDVTAEPGMSTETEGPGRKVMSRPIATCMKWRRQNHEEGTKCGPKSRPCTEVCTMCTLLLAEQTRDERNLHAPQKQQSDEDPRRRFGLVMSSPQLLAMNEGRPTTGHRNNEIGRHIP